MTIISSTTVPILDSAGRPANGRVYIEQSNRYESTAGLVTTTRGWARVTNGVITSQSGGQLSIPATPADQVVWFHEDFTGGTGVVRWATVIPDTSEVGYSDLPETVPPAAGTGVPAWVSDVLTAVDDAETAAASAVAAAAAAEAVGTTNDTIISGRINDTGSATRASLNATIATTGDVRYVRKGQPIAATIETGLASTAITLLGDSTGNESDEWFPLIIDALIDSGDAAAFEIRHQVWDHVGQRMPRPTVSQAAPSGARNIAFTGTAGQDPKWYAAAVVGDIDVRARLEPTAWGNGSEQVILAQFPDAAANDRAWAFTLTSSGQMSFQWSVDGTTLQTAALSGAWTPGAGALWVRATLDVDNGASGHAIAFYRSTDGETWTQVGTTVTRAGTTSIRNSTAAYQMGARGTSAGLYAGKVYEVSIRDGIGDAPEVVPCLPEHWRKTASTPSPTGSPILTFVNSSHPGATFTYLADTARMRKMTPNWGCVGVILSSSHNEQSVTGAELRTTIDAYATAVAGRYPAVPFTICTQNPRVSPATRITEQALRRTEYITWAAAWGWSVIDSYAAFDADPRGVAALVDPDGFHPNADGSLIWAQVGAGVLGLPIPA